MRLTTNMADPKQAPTPESSNVPKTTISIAGLAVDVYGLDELTSETSNVSCLWLHHGRTRKKEDMADVAKMMISGFHHSNNASNTQKDSSRGLIVASFDQRNHGTRLTDRKANSTWKSGNTRHAQDMFATVTGTVVDTMHLMDVLEGYLWLDEEAAKGKRKVIDQHLVLGVSLGGHCVWQLLFEDPRISAGIVVIGCPDYMRLMSDRASGTKLSTYKAADNGASFLGSNNFPPSLVTAAKRWDPKARLFGTEPIPSDASTASEQQKSILDSTIRGKRVQLLSGGQDKLVPYAAGKAFIDWYKDFTEKWWGSKEVVFEDNVYPMAGHEFTEEMKKDALRFVLESVGVTEKVAGRGVGSPKM